MSDLGSLSDAELLAHLGAPQAQPSGVYALSDAELLAHLSPPAPAAPEPATGDQSAAIGRGLINGVPVVGPYMLGGLNRAAAGIRSLQNGTPFADELQNVEGFSDRTAKANPGSTMAGEIAGGVVGTAPLVVAAPAAFGAGAAGLGARSLASMASGAALGGADAAVRSGGNLSDTAQGLGVGAVFGAAAPGAGQLVGRGLNAAADALAVRRIPVPGMGNPAASMLGEDIANSGGVPAVQGRLAELGPQALPLDASPSLMGTAQGLAVQPQTRQAITAPLIARDTTTNQRLAQGLDAALGPAPVPSQIETQFADIRGRAGPMYERALSQPVAVDTAAPLAEIGAQLNTASGAERAALLRARDLLMPNGPDGAVPRTDPRYLHGAKRSLDDLITYGDSTIGVPQGALSREDGAVSRVRGALNGALEEQVPGYASANLTSRTGFRASDALESGGKVLGGGDAAIHPADFAADLASRPLEQQAALRLGLRADLDRTVGNTGNDLVGLRKEILQEGDWNRQKLNTAFGQEPVNQLAQVIDSNTAFRNAYQKVVENSQTAQRTASAARVAPRDVSPSGTSGISLAGLLGGAKGAAGAAALKGGKMALNAAGRQQDIERNQQIARFLTTQESPERTATIQALADRLAATGQNRAVSDRTNAMVRLLLQSQGDRSRFILPSR